MSAGADSGHVERHDQLLDRLHELRTSLPILATEPQSARPPTAQLRAEGKRLVHRIRELKRRQAQMGRSARQRGQRRVGDQARVGLAE
ncbi:MAG TPA: hypothetical protein VL988_04910 [Solirubrobacteraceae bacterium]|nr:hypothetical protein [Solirubrobacteraceae bacterium]HUA74080.1 hypothetical protein [Solirubrobacteraceae bacterium]